MSDAEFFLKTSIVAFGSHDFDEFIVVEPSISIQIGLGHEFP